MEQVPRIEIVMMSDGQWAWRVMGWFSDTGPHPFAQGVEKHLVDAMARCTTTVQAEPFRQPTKRPETT